MDLQKACLVCVFEGRELLWDVFAGLRVQRKDYRSFLPHFHEDVWVRVLRGNGECPECFVGQVRAATGTCVVAVAF